MWHEETVSEARHKLIEAGVERDEPTLTVGAVCGGEPRYPVEGAGAAEQAGVRAASEARFGRWGRRITRVIE